MNLPTAQQLRCLVAVADKLHFGDAADACNLSQPAFSAQIAGLEKTLGTSLVERTTRRVILTPTGSELALRATVLLDELEAFVALGREHCAPLSTSMRLGVIPTVAPYLLPPLLARLRRSHPELKLVLREEQTNSLVESLKRDRIDVALLALPVEAPGTVMTPIGEETLYLVAPADHPLAKTGQMSVADLAGHEILLLENGHCLRDQVLSVCARSGARQIDAIRASSISTLIQMVANGIGLTLLPASAVRSELRNVDELVAVPFRDPAPTRTLVLLTRSSWGRQQDAEALRPLCADLLT